MMVTQKPTSKNTIIFLIFFLFGLIFLTTACQTAEIPVQQCPEINCPEVDVPEPMLYEDLWALSAHANSSAEAFNHWNEEDPQEIPVECANCHSRPGFIDFIGADGSIAGIVENPAPIGTNITCYVCHNEVSLDLASAVFPSGVTIRGLGPEARCIQCHQGRGSTSLVDQAILESGSENDDLPNPELSFINSHSTSAATIFGTEVKGAYEYSSQMYAERFFRGEEVFSCIRCHDQHTLALKFETCSECHTIVGSEAKDIRVNTTDFNGDGDIQEGISYEIENFHESLLSAIQTYAIDIVGVPIAYDLQTYPYFFIDTNENGTIEEDEAVFTNSYNAWTPRLLRAAYNYNYVSHDPGAYAHNSTYILQILYDSLADIGGETAELSRP